MIFRKNYYFLSNMYPATFEAKGSSWSSVEHFYQAMKSLDPKFHAKIKMCNDGFMAKRVGGMIPLRKDWENIKKQVMFYGVKRKFTQNPELAQKLVNLEEDIIFDNTHTDKFWGVYNGEGQNHLGLILTEVREILIALTIPF